MLKVVGTSEMSLSARHGRAVADIDVLQGSLKAD